MCDKNHRIPLMLGVVLIINLAFTPTVLARPRGGEWAIVGVLSASMIRGTAYHDWNANGTGDPE